MFKLSRNVLLVIFLIALLIVPAYGESDKIEHPIIFIPCGQINEYIFLKALLDRAGIIADLIYDSSAQIILKNPSSYSYSDTNWSFGEIESNQYKTAVFVFGTINVYYEDPVTSYQKSIDIDELIGDLKAKIYFCKQNGINMVGLLFYESSVFFSIKSFMIKIIDEITPHMDSLMILRNSNVWPELGDFFVEVGERNEIPIESFSSVKIPGSLGSEVIQELSTRFSK